MNRFTSRRKNPSFSKIEPRASNIIKAVICLNQEKIRKDYIRKCKRSMKDLEKVKKEILDYETTDLPMFEKWYHSQFGRLLSEIRETHEKAKELFHKIREIEYYSKKKNISYYEAFLLVEDKLKNPEKYIEEEEPDHEYFEFSDEEDDYEREWEEEETSSEFHSHEDPEIEKQIEQAFREFLRDNPEFAHFSRNSQIYKLLYETFRKRFFEDYHLNHSEKPKPEGTSEIEAKIKAKYRELARKLHPDYRKELNPYFDELWYEVQIAYKNRDLNRLEMLLALSSIHQGDFNGNFSISQILEVQKEFKEQIKALRARLKIIKKNDAWGFSKLESTKPLEKKISKRLEENLFEEKENLAYFQYVLKKWSTPPSQPKQKQEQHTTFKTLRQATIDDSEFYWNFLFD